VSRSTPARKGLVAKRPDGSRQRGAQARLPDERVLDDPPLSVKDDDDTAPKTAQLQRVEVEQPANLGIGSIENLESTIEPETFDDVGAYPPSDGVGPLDDHDAQPGITESHRS
jgi:hypothetical protein